MFLRAIGIFLLLITTSCSDETYYAPVTEINTTDPIPKNHIHRVTDNETLYSIAWRYGLDYRFLARRNQIKPPFTIHVDDFIYLVEDQKSDIPAKVSPPPKSPPTPSLEPQFKVEKWTTPTKAPLLGGYSSVHKGINFIGKKGEPIYAAAPGKVVYAGNGLRHYGNLIILKHNNIYLSAYAHNQQLFVKEGEVVRQGQKIAEMGNTGAERNMLHFEIRRAGRSINPLPLLGSLNGTRYNNRMHTAKGRVGHAQKEKNTIVG